jgi:hypothetical protein
MYREDDSVKSNNTPGTDSYRNDSRDFSIYRCIVNKVKYIDDAENLSKNSPTPEVMYDCVVIGGYKEGHIFPNCRVATPFGGGQHNFGERIYRSSSKSLVSTSLNKQDGDIVFVSFISGDTSKPIILGGGVQPLDRDSTGAKKSDGPIKKEQYNGILTLVDKNGNYSLTKLGGKYDAKKGIFIPNSSSKKIIVEYTGEKITRSFESGLKIVEDGANDAVTITTASGAEISLDGNAGTVSITSGSATVEIDAAGKISLKGDFVDLGSSASDFVTLFTELATAFASHSHIGNLGSSTSPPLAPLLPSVGSLTVKAQS